MQNTSDRHDPVVGVVALLPMFSDRGTKVGDSPSESVMTLSHIPNQNRIPTFQSDNCNYANAAGFWLFQALVSSCWSTCGLFISSFHLKMSDFSEIDSMNHPGCDSEGERSVASSFGSEVQDSRKRPRPPQIQGNAWILCCKITIIELHADSD
jgi:hypothetical protein